MRPITSGWPGADGTGSRGEQVLRVSAEGYQESLDASGDYWGAEGEDY